MSRIHSDSLLLRLLRARKLVAALGVVAAILLLLYVALDESSDSQDQRTNLATDGARPIMRVLSSPVSAIRSVGQSLGNYVTAHRRLGQLERLRSDMISWRERAVKAEALIGNYEALLKLKPDSDYNYIGARVFGDMGGAMHRHLLANFGRQDGAHVGQAALGPKGFVGHVIAAGTRTSRIMLVTDANSHVAVLVSQASHRAIMSGDGTDQPYLQFIDDSAALEAGAAVVTSGHDGYIPAGLPVGELLNDADRWRVRLWETPKGLEHVRIVELPNLSSPVRQELPLQLLP